MTDASTIVGLHVEMQRTIDKPCSACGHTVVVIKEGAGLHCAECDRSRGKLPQKIVEFLGASIGRFGWPDEAITIRNSEFLPTPESANAAPCADPDSVMGAASDQDQEIDA